MIFFLNQDGTIYGSVGESIRQGSANCNKFYVVAPISSATRVEIAFQLPNGLKTAGYLMSVSQAIDSIDLSEIIPNASGLVSYWALDLPAYVTQYAGLCKAQLMLKNEDNDTIASDAFSFTITAGVAPAEIPDDPENLQTILDAFTAFANEVLHFQGVNPVIDATDLNEGDLIEYDGTETDATYGVTQHKVKSAGIASVDIPLDFDVATGADNESVVTPKNKDGDDLTPFTIENAKTAKNDEQNSRITTTYVRDVDVSIDANNDTKLLIKRKKVENGALVDSTQEESIDSVKKAYVDRVPNDIALSLHDLQVSADGTKLVGVASDGSTKAVSVYSLILKTLQDYGIHLNGNIEDDVQSALQAIVETITLQTSVELYNLEVNGNAVVEGDLVVRGRYFSEDIENLSVKDRIIVLNHSNNPTSPTMAGIAIITAKIDATHFTAFGLMVDTTSSLGDSVKGGYGTLEIEQTEDDDDTYTFTFSASNYPIVLRNGLVNNNLVKFNSSTHCIEDSGKSLDDLYYEGQSKGAEGEFVGVNDQGKIGLIAMTDPVLNKYFTPTAVTPKVIDYYGAFSVQFSAFPTNATQIRVTIGSTYNFDLILDDTPEIEEFAVYYNGNLVYNNNYVETADGKIYCDFSVYDLSAYVSFNLLRNLAVTLSVTYTGDDNPSYALKGYLSAKVLDYVLTQLYANDDTKVAKSSSPSIVYGTNSGGNPQNYPLAETPLANGQVPMASAGGRIQSGANTLGSSQPTNYNHLTRKDYVDTADSALVFAIVDGD